MPTMLQKQNRCCVNYAMEMLCELSKQNNTTQGGDDDDDDDDDDT